MEPTLRQLFMTSITPKITKRAVSRPLKAFINLWDPQPQVWGTSIYYAGIRAASLGRWPPSTTGQPHLSKAVNVQIREPVRSVSQLCLSDSKTSGYGRNILVVTMFFVFQFP